MKGKGVICWFISITFIYFTHVVFLWFTVLANALFLFSDTDIHLVTFQLLSNVPHFVIFQTCVQIDSIHSCLTNLHNTSAKASFWDALLFRYSDHVFSTLLETQPCVFSLIIL